MDRRKFFRRLGSVAVGSVVAPTLVIKALSPIATKYQMGVDVGLGRDIAVTTIHPRSTPFLDMFKMYEPNWTHSELVEIKKKEHAEQFRHEFMFGPGSYKK